MTTNDDFVADVPERRWPENVEGDELTDAEKIRKDSDVVEPDVVDDLTDAEKIEADGLGDDVVGLAPDEHLTDAEKIEAAGLGSAAYSGPDPVDDLTDAEKIEADGLEP